MSTTVQRQKLAIDGVTMHEAAGHYLGFCVVTDEGLVQVVYCRDDQPSVWRFERLESGRR